MPLAGAGKRFADKGFSLPKPLIPIDGLPMVIQAARALPDADQWFFLCQQEHIREYSIDALLHQEYPGSTVIPVNGLTAGQLATCLLAEPFVGSESQLTIGVCDIRTYWNREKFRSEFKESHDADALIWTFRNNPAVNINPSAYGWVQADEKGFVEKVSVKVSLSNTPIRDHAVSGIFSFKKAGYFFQSAQHMIQTDRRVHNEFYNDECMNVLIEAGKNVKVFEGDMFVSFGTPEDVWTYEYWKDYFLNHE